MQSKTINRLFIPFVALVILGSFSSCEMIEQQSANQEEITRLNGVVDSLVTVQETLRTELDAAGNKEAAIVAKNQMPSLGEITIFAGSYAPRGWAECRGQLLPLYSYSKLYEVLGTKYGGDGKNTFALPDYQEAQKAISPNGSSLGKYIIYIGG